jgi:hypothetical protein
MKRFTQIFVLIIFGAFLSGCGIIGNTDKFNSEKWKKGDNRARGKMVYDLQNRKLLIGKNELEVDKLLGKADFLSPNPNIEIYVIDTNTFSNKFFLFVMMMRRREFLRPTSAIKIKLRGIKNYENRRQGTGFYVEGFNRRGLAFERARGQNRRFIVLSRRQYAGLHGAVMLGQR